MPAISRLPNATQQPACSAVSSKSTLQGLRLFKIGLGVLAFQGAARANGMNSMMTGSRQVSNNTIASLSPPYVFSGSSDGTRLQVYDLKAVLLGEGQPIENAAAKQPYRVVSQKVTGGIMTALVQEHVLDLTLLSDTGVDDSAPTLQVLADTQIASQSPSRIYLDTIGHSSAGLGSFEFSKSPIDGEERVNRAFVYAPCLSVDSKTFQLQEFFRAELLTGKIEQVMPLPANNDNNKPVPECNDSANLVVTAIYRGQSGEVRLAMMNKSLTRDFVVTPENQSARLSYLAFARNNRYVAVSTEKTVSLYAYDADGTFFSPGPHLFESAVRRVPEDATLDINIPLVARNSHFLGAGVSELGVPVVIKFGCGCDEQNLVEGEVLSLAFLNSPQQKIIGLSADAEQVYLLVAVNQDNGVVEHQNWRIDLIDTIAPTMVPTSVSTGTPTRSPAPTSLTESPARSAQPQLAAGTPVSSSLTLNPSETTRPTSKAFSAMHGQVPSMKPAETPASGSGQTSTSAAQHTVNAARALQLATVAGALLFAQVLFR